MEDIDQKEPDREPHKDDKDENGSLDTNISKRCTLCGVHGYRPSVLDGSTGSKEGGKGQRRTEEYFSIAHKQAGIWHRRSEADNKRRETGEVEDVRTSGCSGQCDDGKDFGPGFYHIKPQERLHAGIRNVQRVREDRTDKNEAREEPISGIREARTELEHVGKLSGHDSEPDKNDISQVIKLIGEFAPERAELLRAKRDRSKVLASANDALERFFNKLGLTSIF